MSSTKRFKAAVIGGTGYGGGEMIRRLLIHPEVDLVRVAAIDFVDEPLWSAHPNLTGLTDLTFEDIRPSEAAKGCDVAMLGMPHKVTAAKVPELVEMGVKVVNMSGDFRLRDTAAYAKYYGVEHPVPELLPKFVYGLPELWRDKIIGADYVSSPGCFATCIALALLPLARTGLLTGPIHVTSITGSSGSGAYPKAATHHPVRYSNLKAYKVLTHQHTPEIEQTLIDGGGKDFQLRFVPQSGSFARGIFTTAFLEVDPDLDEARLEAMFDETYESHPFVRRPTTRLPEVAAVAGSNYTEVGFKLSDPFGGKRTLTCFSANDNLIKGGAGQAIQNMNLILGLDEKLSLEDPGAWP